MDGLIFLWHLGAAILFLVCLVSVILLRQEKKEWHEAVLAILLEPTDGVESMTPKRIRRLKRCQHFLEQGLRAQCGKTVSLRIVSEKSESTATQAGYLKWISQLQRISHTLLETEDTQTHSKPLCRDDDGKCFDLSELRVRARSQPNCALEIREGEDTWPLLSSVSVVHSLTNPKEST